MPSGAVVSENVTYSSYDVNVAKGLSIARALQKATPHRVGDQTFYGFTTWNVFTSFQSHIEPNGSCRIVEVETKFSVNIDLPTLVGANSRQSTEFDTFLDALRVHEFGHYSIGKEAAVAIDAKISTLPEMKSCKALDAAAGLANSEIMREFEARGANYDVQTDHGKTQGAWINDRRKPIQSQVMPPRSS